MLFNLPLVSIKRSGVVITNTAKLHSTNTMQEVSEIQDGEDLWQWSQLEIRLKAFHRSTISQKQFIQFNYFYFLLFVRHFYFYCCQRKCKNKACTCYFCMSSNNTCKRNNRYSSTCSKQNNYGRSFCQYNQI